MGRITQVTHQDQSTKTFVYDCCSLTSATDSNGTITLAYDTLKRLSSVTDIYGKVVSFDYDKNSNLSALTYPDGRIVNYDYDDANRLTKVTDWLSNLTAYNYDLAGDLIKTNYPDGSTINYQFDNGWRLTSITDLKVDGSLNAFYKYTLDQLGNKTGILFSQPLNAKPTPADTTYTHDVDNRLLTAATISFGYDDNGNLTTKTVGSNVTNYSWDFNDMLTQVTKDGNTYAYRYNAFGNRVAKVVNSVETRYVGSLAETDATGNITAYYVYGLGLISKITPTNQSYFYHFDGLGSTIAITDSSGNVVNKYAYNEHGKVLSQEEVISNPFKYVGRFGVMDERNGLLYMRARYYDPEVGRFISKDPIGFAGGLNLYAYVGSNPMNRIDPWGLFWEYHQGTGELWYIPANRGDPELVGKGFSGREEGRNNSLYELVEDKGPIPRGDWRIGLMQEIKTRRGVKLLFSMRLEPAPGTWARGGGFIIHGGKFSEGCPVFDEATRKRIGNSQDKTWRVVR